MDDPTRGESSLPILQAAFATTAQIHHGRSDEQKFDHPTQKPVELIQRPLLNHTKRGEPVYEPFLGSGTTLAAAEITERVCWGIDLDEKYVDTAVLRWQALAGGQATLDGDGRTFEEIAQERRSAGLGQRPPEAASNRKASSHAHDHHAETN